MRVARSVRRAAGETGRAIPASRSRPTLHHGYPEPIRDRYIGREEHPIHALGAHAPGNNRAEELRDGLIKATAPLPAALRKSLTWDQESEMGKHAEFAAVTRVPVYFCDLHSPWQRGTNENTNGLLRQYFPKEPT
jgi:hypothetical protein